MNGIEKHAAFYRGYLTDERSLVPLTIVLATVVALWLLVYLVAAVADPHQDAGVGRVASVTLIRHRPPANSIRRDLPALSPLLCNRGRLRSLHAELAPQSDKRRRRGRGGKLTPGCIR